jgi:multicomponent Na+:H+ antiporter subunit A
MLTAILVGFLGALGAPWLQRRLGAAAGWVLALLPLGLFVYFVTQIPAVTSNGGVRHVHPWVPGLNVQLSFVLDGLSLLFALLITGLGALIVAYAGGYLKGHEYQGRFFLLILLFMGAMLGLVLADNLITLFVFWELTSIVSFLLIGFKHDGEGARASALQALLVTAFGGLALLAGFVLLGIAAGSFELSELLAGDAAAVTGHALYPAILLLVVLGAITKSAQVPFHFWLPNAMAAPTPVSAYLHSATMVKAGVYLLARMDPLLGDTLLWVWLLSAIGAATMLTGAVLAVRQTDLKRVLAYTTVTALGTLVLLLGLSFEASVIAAVVFLVVHSLYKGALFLIAGTVDHQTGTRDVLRLGGLRHAMPITAVAAVLAGLSMAGLPPLFGFVGKELAYKAKLGVDGMWLILPAVAVVANALTMVAAGLLVLRPFFGAARSYEGRPEVREAPASMWLGPVVLGAVGLGFGFVPGLLAGGLIGPAVSAVLGYPVPVELALWYGFDTALLLSIATVLLGVAGYLSWTRLHARLARADRLLIQWPERAYDASVAGMLAVARAHTRWLQRDDLRFSLAVVLGTSTLLVGFTLLAVHDVDSLWARPEAYLHEWALAGLIVVAAGAAVWTRSRLAAVVALGGVGFGIALLFVLLGAPDVAMTQFLVETLLVIILLLVLQRLPRPVYAQEAANRTRAMRLRNAAIAGGVGAVMAGLLLAVTRIPFDTRISEFFAQEAVPGGYGRNIVNVILVDFRALDTLGEIVVLAAAALGVLALVRMRGPRTPREEVTS